MPPSPVTILAVCNGVEATLAPLITGLARSQSMDELTEDYPDLPLMQVYWTGDDTDPNSVNNDRTTFGKHVSVTERVVNVDLIVRQRSQLGEDMAAVAANGELLIAALDAQTASPLFGVAGCKGLSYRVEYVTFQRGGSSEGGQAVLYVGVRAILTVRIF